MLLAQLRLTEKRILRGTMDGVRRRLAPIRGIPTKVSLSMPLPLQLHLSLCTLLYAPSMHSCPLLSTGSLGPCKTLMKI